MTLLSRSTVLTFNKIKTVFHISNRKYKPKEMNKNLSALKDLSDNLKDVFDKSVTAVKPQSLINYCFEVKQSVDSTAISVKGHEINITQKNVKLVGFGKAVLGMAVQVQNKLDSLLKGGILSIPTGTLETFKNNPNLRLVDNIKVFEGALNNIPDENAFIAGKEIYTYLKSCQENDTIIVLISGGGSALLTCPISGVNYAEKATLVKALANNGANIRELNIVRKKLSNLKGGKLAEIAHPATVVALVLSDVIGDDLEVIASGPTVPNEDHPEDAKNVIEKYHLEGVLSSEIRKYIYDTTNRPAEKITNASTFIIGNNKVAVDAAALEASSKGYIPIIMSTEVQGDVKTISKIYKELVVLTVKYISKEVSRENYIFAMKNIRNSLKSVDTEYILQYLDKFNESKGVCFILGGEPTVVVTGEGVGGRNQQLALQLGEDLHSIKKDLDGFDVVFLSGGTDGIDGPTNAAGAISFPALYDLADEDNLKAHTFLLNNDSNTFYRQFYGGEYLISTGITGTNVMDIHCLLIAKSL